MATGTPVKQDDGWQDYATPAKDDGWQDAPATSAPAPATEKPGILDREIPLTSHLNATLSGLQSVGRGVRDAAKGAFGLIDPRLQPGESQTERTIEGPMYPVARMMKGFGETAKQATQVPGAIRDINASPDPVGSYGKMLQEDAGQGAGQALVGAATEGLGRTPQIPFGRIARTGLKTVGDVSIEKPFAMVRNLPKNWHDTSPDMGMLHDTKQAIKEMRASKIPTRVKMNQFGEPAGGAKAASPDISFVPEPRDEFHGEQPNYMASVPRNELAGLAKIRKPGAGTQLQQLGKPIIYIPKEADLPRTNR